MSTVKSDDPVEFHQNDEDYVKWVKLHPSGYVANSRPRAKKGGWCTQVRENDPKVHKASCDRWIIPYLEENPTHSYTKICSTDLQKLIEWLEKEIGTSSICNHCYPVAPE